MPFFSRPILNNDQFRQMSGETLTLSGETDFVGILKSKGIEIDATVTGASTGMVLTYIGSGKIELAPISGTTAFDGNRSITQTAGTPSAAGNVGGTTVTEFLENYFFPAVPPGLSLSATLSSRQFGDSSSGVLNWTATRNTNALTVIELDTNGDAVYDTGNLEDGSGNSQAGSTGYTFQASDSNPATGTTQVSRTYRLRVQTASETGTTTTNVTWRHRRFWFTSNVLYFSGNTTALETLLNGGGASSELSTSRAKNFGTINPSGEYFYYIHPISFGQPSYVVNGLPNNAWGNPSDNPPTLIQFNYQNSDGYTEPFYIGRSDSTLTGSFTVVAS